MYIRVHTTGVSSETAMLIVDAYISWIQSSPGYNVSIRQSRNALHMIDL